MLFTSENPHIADFLILLYSDSIQIFDSEKGMKLKKGMKSAAVLRAGPPNGPYSAQWFSTMREGLLINDCDDFAGIYATSGPSPTALLGCIGEDKKLCDTWFNLRPEDVVGNHGEELRCFAKFLKRFEHLRTAFPRISDFREFRSHFSVIRRLKDGHVFSNLFLYELIKKHAEPYLDRIFSPEAALIKIGTTDFFTGQHIVFSNRVPEHKDLIFKAVVASMGIVPLFPPFLIEEDPRKLKLTDSPHSYYNTLSLIDGGYRASLLIEEAIREPVNYDMIFIVDIDGFDYDQIRPDTPHNLITRIRRSESIASTTNDRLRLSLVDRINEGIFIRDQEIEARDELIKLKDSMGDSEKLDPVIKKLNDSINRMNNGRLRLSDKRKTGIVPVSSPDSSFPFDFSNFTQAEVTHLMRAGHNAALKTLGQLGLSTKGIPVIRP